ncbi:MAG: hypothetical protein HYV07_10240 [Deltaproteobacteria bacterium]|nr:hypothetical protein [Deltaproteobacteria bacterium]
MSRRRPSPKAPPSANFEAARARLYGPIDPESLEGLARTVVEVLGSPAPEAEPFEAVARAIEAASRFAARAAVEPPEGPEALERAELVLRGLVAVLPWLSRTELALAEALETLPSRPIAAEAPLERFSELRRATIDAALHLHRALSAGYGRLLASSEAGTK